MEVSLLGHLGHAARGTVWWDGASWIMQRHGQTNLAPPVGRSLQPAASLRTRLPEVDIGVTAFRCWEIYNAGLSRLAIAP